MNSSRSPAVLACECCTRKKIKCDKRSPCTACSKANVQCVPTIRTRLARGRNGGRKQTVRTELTSRVKRLETIVGSLGLNQSLGQVEKLSIASRNVGIVHDSNWSDVDNSNRHPITFQHHEDQSPPSNTSDISRLMGSTLWLQLSEELTELRSVLEDMDEELDEYPSGSDSLMFSPSPSFNYPILEAHEVNYLLQILQQDVDPIIKILHIPTFIQHIKLGLPYLSNSSGSPPAGALRSAVFLTCFCSLSGSRYSDKDDSRRHEWQSATEYWLNKANLSTSQNIVTLQALIFYLAAIRSNDTGIRSWTLIGLATRLAQALLLHRESSYISLSFYKSQIYRQTFHVLVVLDMKASFDRGSDPLLSANTYDTDPPLHIRDEDFSSNTVKPIPRVDCFTEMTFSLTSCEMMPVRKELNYVSAGDLKRDPLPIQESWQARQDAVIAVRERVHAKCLRHCDQSIPIQLTCLKMAELTLNHLQLYIVRPMQRHPKLKPPPKDSLNVLLCATEVLEARTAFLTQETKSFHWLVATFVSWHALAIVLAELCIRQDDPTLIKRSWLVAEEAFTQIREQIAGGLSGSLWRSIEKLMAGATGRRLMDAQLKESCIPHDFRNDLETDPLQPFEAEWNLDYPIQAEDSWNNWQGFIDDIALNNDLGILSLPELAGHVALSPDQEDNSPDYCTKLRGGYEP